MTTIVLTEGTSWTVPTNWNNGANTIECYGGGASGLRGPSSSLSGNGGGGGGYGKKTNLALTLGASVSYQIGQGSIDGDGTDTWFKTASTVKGGGGKRDGTGGSGIGNVVHSGGYGGPGRSSAVSGGGGGGGAAGASGDGGDGEAGLSMQGGDGGPGTGIGGDGGKGGSPSYNQGGMPPVIIPATPGLPGSFPGGGGGGGPSNSGVYGGEGAPGQIIITYTPAKLIHWAKSPVFPNFGRRARISKFFTTDIAVIELGPFDLTNDTVWQAVESLARIGSLGVKSVPIVYQEDIAVAINLVIDSDWELRSFVRGDGIIPRPPLPGVPSMVLSSGGIYSIENSAPTPQPDIITEGTSYSLVHNPSQTEIVVSVTKVDGTLREVSVVFLGTTLQVTNTDFVATLEAMAAEHETNQEQALMAALATVPEE